MRRLTIRDLRNITYQNILLNFKKLHPHYDKNVKFDIKGGIIACDKLYKKFVAVKDKVSKKYGFPKGSLECDKDRDILETALREFLEETGITISLEQLTYAIQHVFRFVRHGQVHYSFYVYVVVELEDSELDELIKNAHIDKNEIMDIKLLNFRKQMNMCECNNFHTCTYITQSFFKHLLALHSY